MIPAARQLLLCALLFPIGGCAEIGPSPQATLTSASGARRMDAFYGIYFEPAEGGGVDVDVVVLFVDPSWGCSSDAAADPDAISFRFPRLAADRTSQLVLSRAGPTLGPTSGGTGEVHLTLVDDRFRGNDANGPIVDEGGRMEGHVQFSVGDLRLEGDFVAPHCALIDFRNAV